MNLNMQTVLQYTVVMSSLKHGITNETMLKKGDNSK